MGKASLTFSSLYEHENIYKLHDIYGFDIVTEASESIVGAFIKRLSRDYKTHLHKELLCRVKKCAVFHIYIFEAGYEINKVFIINNDTAKVDVLRVFVTIITEIRNSILVKENDLNFVFEFIETISNETL